MDYNTFIQALKGLIKDDTSTEDATQIGSLINDVEQLKGEHESLIKSHEDLRQKYIKAIQNSGVSAENPNQPPQEKTLEDCVNEVISKRK